MICFVSDLHLVDSDLRSSLDVRPFVQELEACLDRCGPEEECTLVLLGDIFELLKSDRWIGSGLRPWSSPSARLVHLVGEILHGVYTRNCEFFDEVNRLCRERELRLLYIPGNHDGLMFSSSMGPVRAALRGYLPGLTASDSTDPFPSSVTDTSHGVYAEHGHEFDTFNRVQRDERRVVPGDVVVVEIVAHLAFEAAKELRLADPMNGQHHPELRFLQDLDDIVPQDATSLVAWIEFGLAGLSPSRREVVEKAVCKAIGHCLKRAASAVSTDSNASAAYKAFGSVVSTAIASGRLRAARTVSKFAPTSPTEIAEVSRVAMKVASAVYPDSPSVDIIVAGHTHLPLHHPVMLPGAQVTYLNSGTWRRVLLHQPLTTGDHAFAKYFEATLVCVFQRDGDRPLRYDYRRRTYGG